MYEDLIKRLRDAHGGSEGIKMCTEAADVIEKLSRDFVIIDDMNHDKDIEIEELKSELEEVKRERDAAIKHGRWKRFEEIGGNIGVSCSACRWKDYQHGKYKSNLYNYCPNCGAKMDAEEEKK